MAPSPQPHHEPRSKSRLGGPPRGAPALSGAGAVALAHGWEDEELTDPRAEGACLFDLSAEEWRVIRNAPLASFLRVAGADGMVLPRERRALVSAIEEGKRSSSLLFRAVCRELYRQREALVELFVTDAFERGQLVEAYRLVVLKLGQDEAEAFKTCLLKLGRQVAKASGGLVASWGWLRGVEQRALAELEQALSLGPATRRGPSAECGR